MNIEEKVIILASLFHDIGKFQQRCSENPERIKHDDLSVIFINENKNNFLSILDNDKSAFNKLLNFVSSHHADNGNTIIKDADKLSASQRQGNYQNWGHKYLSSLFAKIRLNNEETIINHYFNHSLLNQKNYKSIIPEFDKEEDALKNKSIFDNDTWNNFKEEINYFLTNMQNDEDFPSLISNILNIYEKYLWCIPDFTGTEKTDISLYNHLKDTAAFAHSIFLSDNNSKSLYLVVGDIPGIQNYIFSVVGKPAKMLRGRSLYVQLLSKVFSLVYLKEFGLTEANIIMVAGGKFYLLCPDINNFEESFHNVKNKIENYLFDTFHMKLRFNAGYSKFSRIDLYEKKINFGDVIEGANISLQNDKLHLFEDKLFNSQFNYILKEGFLDKKVDDKDKLKCFLTGDPILKDEGEYIEENKNVTRQAKREYEAGEKVVSESMIAEVDEEMNINFFKFSEYNKVNNFDKIIINPDDKIRNNYTNANINLFRNSYFLQVANYASKDNGGNILDFSEIEECNKDAAKFLTLVKGDIDNLGLIMAFGLINDNPAENLNAVSRITTLSHHLQYFFSYYFNGFLENFEKEKDCKLYTIFAGGDDMMIICPQKFALDFVKNFNDRFSDFICHNKEIHISYSITHFKNSTPVRIVTRFSEENQELAKKDARDYKPEDKEFFCSHKNKASIYIHNTVIKNSLIDKIINNVNLLEKWCKEEKISMGIIRNLLRVSENMKAFRENGDTTKLIWHPILTYQINRLLKKNGKYIDLNLEKFFETVLSINRQSDEAKQMEEILYPIVCNTIYKLRNF